MRIKKNKYSLHCGLSLQDKVSIINTDSLLKFVNPPTFRIDGTEEQIINRLKLQLCSIFALHYQNQGIGTFEKNLNNLIKKYKIKKD